MSTGKYILLVFLLLAFSSTAKSQIFISAGADYIIPFGEFKDVNEDSPGFSIQLESRRFCNLWYGIRVDYSNLNQIEDTENTYESIFMLSPEIRYVFNNKPCGSGSVQFYLQGMLNLSSIQGTDELNAMGLGASAGGGIAVPFDLWDTCWSIDFGALYSAPNFILKENRRPALQSVLFNLSIGMQL